MISTDLRPCTPLRVPIHALDDLNAHGAGDAVPHVRRAEDTRHAAAPAEIENTIRWLFSPFRDSRKQVRSLVGMETASLQLTFVDMYRKNGVDPSEAYQRLLDDPEWDMTGQPRPPPPPVRRRQL